ncbi:hypothetical protein Tco_0363329 [Tanacetum coccineum]
MEYIREDKVMKLLLSILKDNAQDRKRGNEEEKKLNRRMLETSMFSTRLHHFGHNLSIRTRIDLIQQPTKRNFFWLSTEDDAPVVIMTRAFKGIGKTIVQTFGKADCKVLVSSLGSLKQAQQQHFNRFVKRLRTQVGETFSNGSKPSIWRDDVVLNLEGVILSTQEVDKAMMKNRKSKNEMRIMPEMSVEPSRAPIEGLCGPATGSIVVIDNMPVDNVSASNVKPKVGGVPYLSSLI